MNGISAEAIVGLIGVTLVVTVSAGFDPLKAWFETRLNGFWAWLVVVFGEQLWIGFWAGFWWSVYSGNRLFESFLFGGGIALLSHAVHEVLTWVSAVANSRARGYAHNRAREEAVRRRPKGLPNVRDPKLSEDEAHALMDAYDDNDPRDGRNNPTLN